MKLKRQLHFNFPLHIIYRMCDIIDSQEKMNILYSFLDEYKVWMIPQQMRQVDCVGVFKKIQ